MFKMHRVVHNCEINNKYLLLLLLFVLLLLLMFEFYYIIFNLGTYRLNCGCKLWLYFKVKELLLLIAIHGYCTSSNMQGTENDA